MLETILENQHRYYNKHITFYPSIPHQASITFFFFFFKQNYQMNE